ncbi:MAG: hypothetical protein ACPGWR_26470 [Ardenticatenaceae bacterium]
MNLNKLVKYALFLLLVVVISGCGPDEPTPEPPTSTTAPESSPTPAPADLTIGMTVMDPDLVNSFARNGDIFAVWVKDDLTWTEGLLEQVPVENRMLMTGSFEGLEESLDSLSVEISYVGYDLERWALTPQNEQDNPVKALKKAHEITRSRGLKLVLAPSRYFNDKFGPQLAPHTDVYVPQMRGYETNLSPAEHRNTLEPLIRDLKAANPEIIVLLDLSPKEMDKTPDEMLESTQELLDLIDGVWITSTQEHADIIETFIKFLR